MTLYQMNNEGAATLRARLQQAREGIDLSYFCSQRPAFSIDADGIAHVWVYGPLLQDAAPVEKDLGATDYADLAAELATEGIRGVLLHVDSPGGTVAGCIEVAKLIEQASVPVVAYVHGMACSAAYKLACGSSHLIASPSATVGNIGTILCWSDSSVMMENLGVTLNAVVSEGASLKSTGHLDSLTDEQKDFLQESINDAGREFVSHVLTNRPGIDPGVFRAGWYSGQKAIDLGLVDELGSLATATERLRELMLLTNGEDYR